MRFFKWRIEKAEYVDALEEIEYRFGCFLCEMTGGRMSKTNYTMEAMVSCANDYRQEIRDECRAGQQGERYGEWKDNHCTACGMTPLGEELWKHLDVEPPKFENCMRICPCCGAKMDGAEREGAETLPYCGGGLE